MTEERSVGDSSSSAAIIQAAIQRKLTGAQRLAVACDMSDVARALALTHFRCEHPGWSDLEMKLELLRYALLPDPLPVELEEQWKAVRQAGGGAA